MAPEVCTTQVDVLENKSPFSKDSNGFRRLGVLNAPPGGIDMRGLHANENDSSKKHLRNEDILALPGIATDDATFSNSNNVSEAPYLRNERSESDYHDGSYKLTGLAKDDVRAASQSTYHNTLKNENGITLVDKDLNTTELSKSDISCFIESPNKPPSDDKYDSSDNRKFPISDKVIGPSLSSINKAESADDPSILTSCFPKSDDTSIFNKTSKENESSLKPDTSHGISNPNQSNENKIEPLVLDMPNLKMALADIKSKSAHLSGVQYQSNLCSVMPNIQELKSVLPETRINDVVLRESHNATFGTKIEAPGDVIVNQYVDLGSNFSPHLNGVIITDSSRPENCCARMKYLWVSLIFGTILTTTLTTAGLVVLRENKIQKAEGLADPGADAPANYSLRLVTRGQWSSHSNSKIPDLKFNPARFSVVSHTAGVFCNTTPICENIVRSIESWHLQIGFGGIGYNFLIGGDGYIYEGRGWGKEGAHTYGYNCASVGVSFIGDFDKDILTPSMIEAFNILMEEGVRRDALAPNYKLFGHYQFKATASPGLNIKNSIKTWPHWTGQVTDQEKCK